MSGDKAVQIAIVGTGTTQGGGVAPTPDGTTAETPTGQPNLIVKVIAPSVAIVVRFAHLYLVTLTGLMTAAGFTSVGQQVLATGDFYGTLALSAKLAVVPAIMGLLKDLVTVFGRLEGKYPLATGSI